MIDTVILTIPNNKITRLDNSRGIFPEWTPQSKTKGYAKWVKNMPDKKGFSSYYPRLTAYNRGSEKSRVNTMVNIEFSVPKLLYKNNLDEVEEKDFSIVIKTLHARLFEMGEVISEAELARASIRAFHPSKNIVLRDGYRAYGVMKEISKINLTKKLELTKVNFKNDGNAIQMYAINHSIVFYDKIADLNQTKKKAVDKDQTTEQLSLFAEIKSKTPKLEVLRLEIRICKKQKIDSLMRVLNLKENPTFVDIFRKDVCQKVVRYFWETIIKGENTFLFEFDTSPSHLLKDIITREPKIKLSKAINLVGLSLLCKDCGIRNLRSITEKHISQRNWYQISNNIKLLNRITERKSLHNWVKQIEDSIKEFKPYQTNIRPP